MTTEYLDDVDVVIECHSNYVNDGDKFNTFTIYKNENGSWGFNLTQEDALKLARFLKKHIEGVKV